MELQKGVSSMKQEISDLKEENDDKIKGQSVFAAVSPPASDANEQVDGLLVCVSFQS